MRRHTHRRLGSGRGQRLVDLQASSCGGIEPSIAILFQTAPQQSVNRDRRVGRQHRWVRLVFENPGQGVGDRVAGEWRAACKHFVEDAAERPDIRPFVQRLATRLFRAHIGGRAQDAAFAEITGGQPR